MIPFTLLKQIAATEGWQLVYRRNLIDKGLRTPDGRVLRTKVDIDAYWASKPPGNPKLKPEMEERFRVEANQALAVMTEEGRILGKLKFCFDSHDESDASLVSREPNPVYRYVLACKLMLSE